MAYKISYKEAGKALTGVNGSDNLFLVASPSDLGSDAITGVDAQVNELRILAESRSTENYVLGANIKGIQFVSIAPESYDPSTNEPVLNDDSAVNIDASKVTSGLTILGNYGSNNIIGTSSDDFISGNGGGDTLTGGMGNDTIQALSDEGDLVLINKADEYSAGDKIVGERITVMLSDSKAWDYVFNAGSTPSKVVLGSYIKGKIDSSGTNAVNLDLSNIDNSIDMSITGNAGNNKLIANLYGSSSITGGLGKDELVGNSDRNTFIYNSDKEFSAGETIDGKDGSDSILLNAAGTYKFNTGSNLVNVEEIYMSASGKAGFNLEISGTSYNIEIYNQGSNAETGIDFGNNGNNVITGGAGNDNVYLHADLEDYGYIAGMGNDKINVGDGDNNVEAGGGNNTVIGGEGYDYFYTLDGNDSISLGNGFYNRAYAGNGNNTITGGTGNDEVQSGIGNDKVTLGEGNNLVSDRGGNNSIQLGSGDDRVNIGDGSFVSKGNSTISLGDGANIIYVNGDNSVSVTAGNGNDYYNDDYYYLSAYRDKALQTNNTIKLGNGNNFINGRSKGNYIIETGLNRDYINLSGNGNNKITDLGGRSFIDSNDTIGTIENQQFYTGNGNDIISVKSGNNYIGASNGNNLITAGSDNDTVTAGDGNDTITGGAGNDNINAGMGKNTIDTGDGNDSITSGLGASIKAGAGNDIISVFAPIKGKYDSSLIDAGDGDDYIVTSQSKIKDTIIGGAGNDTIYSGTGDDSIDGGDGNNNIEAMSGKNSIKSGSGNDYIKTLTGADTISAGDGNNLLITGAGSDLVSTGVGSDTIIAGQGSDTVSAGAGNDLIYADHGGAYYVSYNQTYALYNGAEDGNGADNLSGGAGSDIFIIDHAIWAKNDTINGEAKGVTADANDVDTIVYAETFDLAKASDAIWKVDATKVIGIEKFVIDSDADFTNGTTNNNLGFDLSSFKTAVTIVGNNGNDTLIGGGKDDVIIAGLGTDSLTGGNGADTFVFNNIDNQDTITDFTHGTDKLQLSAPSFAFLSSLSGGLSSENILVGADAVNATTSDQYLIFDTTAKDLYLDIDGNGGEFSAIKIASLTGVTTLDVSDFILV